MLLSELDAAGWVFPKAPSVAKTITCSALRGLPLVTVGNGPELVSSVRNRGSLAVLDRCGHKGHVEAPDAFLQSSPKVSSVESGRLEVASAESVL